MAVEIGTLVLRGRFGPAREDTGAQVPDMTEAFEELRRDLLRAMDERMDEAARRSRER
ncbi:hypothetical protein [uncultured Roseobacter sp.]|uniref:hypothetical protein n=1 Tax=uncultured Roseobacter sp. TaxID=114847 RepID=UPI00260B203C|nr:hypothetical protein [uncultured Roseobacter sp.]